MTYASINEAWGGLSGSTMLTSPMGDHPAHKRANRRRQQSQISKVPPYKTEQDPYTCMYDKAQNISCNQAYNTNQQFNQQQKQVAMGYPPHMNFPGLYYPGSMQSYLPQYPWYNDSRYNYLAYGPAMSHAFYSNPGYYFPQVAQQISQWQQQNNIQPNQITHYGPYQPQGFFPGMYYNPPFPQSSQPQLQPHPQQQQRKKIEHYTNENNAKDDYIRKATYAFIFFLIVLAVILCLFMIAFAHSTKESKKGG